jgi:hypothetical protein
LARIGSLIKRRAEVIAEFAAGDTEATLHAMVAEILHYRHVGHVPFHLPMDLAVPVGWTLGREQSFDHLVGSGEQRLGNGDTKSVCRFHINDELKINRLHDRIGFAPLRIWPV